MKLINVEVDVYRDLMKRGIQFISNRRRTTTSIVFCFGTYSLKFVSPVAPESQNRWEAII